MTTTHLNFTWQADSSYEDGSAIPSTTPITYSLYEDGVKIVDNIADLSFSLLMTGKPSKVYNYSLTATDTLDHLESAPSEPVAISFIVPKPPVGLLASFVIS